MVSGDSNSTRWVWWKKCPSALDNALPMSYHAAISFQPFELCRYIYIFVKISMTKILSEIVWGQFRKRFHIWNPLAPKPLVLNCPKRVRYNYIQYSPLSMSAKVSFPIAQYLRRVMSQKPHRPRWERRETKKVRIIFWRAMFGVKYQDNRWRRKFDFFYKTGKFLYFDMLKIGSRGSNRLGVRKSFETWIGQHPKRLHVFAWWREPAVMDRSQTWHPDHGSMAVWHPQPQKRSNSLSN